MAEFSKSDRADEVETLKLLELLYGRHFRVVFIGSAMLALQQLSGINVVFYFYSNIFKSSGVPSDIATMSVGVVNLSVACCYSRHQVINFFVGLLYLRLLEQLGAQILYSLRKLLLVGIFLCQEQCGGNKRKNFARD
ncbi:hypothetical protein L6452_42591 [Arctium lappa]|uniref:Uncharacterized protein n=1 Tax=Arctium lappa TaxID=4217 RepID=A0ACB8XIL8_ARCLA|nr:hypothetical protein L6452_42591 [Arctium lappa]